MASYELVVEQGKVREFAAAALAEDAFGDVVPPTFLWVANHFWAPRGTARGSDVGLDMSRVLHAEEEFVFHGEPPRAGQVLTVTTDVGQPFEKSGARGGRLRFVVLTNQFRDTGGKLV